MKAIFLLVLLPLLALSETSFAGYRLALNWKAEPQFGGFYQAESAGLFKKENLDIEILEGGSGTPTVQMLANNKVDFAVVSAEEILVQNEKNPKNKVVAIFASFQIAPQIIMTHESRGFKNLKQVFDDPGVIAMQSGLSYARFLLKKWGPPKARIVPYLGGISNFINDPKYSQQGFLTSEPLSAEKAGLKVKSFLIADEGFNPYATVLAVKKDFLEKNKRTVTAVVKAVRQGWQDYLNHPENTNKLMGLKNKSMDPETFAKSARAQAPLILPAPKALLGSMSSERWDQLSQQMLELGLIKNRPTDASFVNLGE
jgi:NitT/TauT family transport system substrate-binding protein